MKLSVAFLLTLISLVQPSEGVEEGDNSFVKFGLALNAGGTTAANGCASAMRGFQLMKISRNGKFLPAMEAFGLVSGASGGNIPSIQYHYTQNTNSDELLDVTGINDPKDLTTEELNSIPEKSMFSSYVDSIVPSAALARIKMNAYGSDFWPEITYNLALGPDATVIDPKIRDGVPSTPLVTFSMVGPADAFPTYDNEYQNIGVAGDILNSTLFKDYFFEYNANKYIATNKTILLQILKNNGFQVPITVFATPDKVIIPFSYEVKMEFDVGGNQTTKPLNFSPFSASYDELSSDTPFTLKKLFGMATDEFVLEPIYQDIFKNTQEPYKPITMMIPTADGDRRKMVGTDGGYVDMTGIPALVKQKTKNIISILCLPPSFMVKDLDPNNFGSYYLIKGLASYFGLKSSDELKMEHEYLQTQGVFAHIFNLNSNGEDQLVKLSNTMQSLFDAGEPMISTLKDVEVIANPFLGISGGWTVDLTVCLFVGVPVKFANEIPDGIVTPPGNRSIVEDGFFTNEEFASVPNVYTPLWALPTPSARMTQVMLTWAIKHSWEGLKVDGEVKFDGFRTIF